ECLLGIEYILLDSTGKPSSDKWTKGLLKNISAAGACLVLDNDLVKGTGLKFKLFLTENLLISAQASVIRSSRVENKNVKKFEHGLYFTEISENDQNKLIKYIFEQQRLILNREAQ
ncbi:MAG: PilZ domain-containing protein, partial [Clostridiales bacterium]|nr:PilZ domain-containing protein [Clostridiales bacterium]